MGVLNVTEDSFSDGGKFLDLKSAVKRGLQIASEGADIIDVGGESTRPGAPEIDSSMELKRVIPVIEELALKNKLKISCDTSKPEVAEAALKSGAVMINDVSGMSCPRMRQIAAENDAAVCIMHMKGSPRTMQKNPHYDNVVEDIKDFLHRQAYACIKSGINRENIIVDPGIGFGKTVEHNLEIIRNIKKIAGEFPVLAGVSRKSFIGAVLNRSVDKRLAGSIACACFLALRGTDMLRVHDVRETADAVEMIRKINND